MAIDKLLRTGLLLLLGFYIGNSLLKNLDPTLREDLTVDPKVTALNVDESPLQPSVGSVSEGLIKGRSPATAATSTSATPTAKNTQSVESNLSALQSHSQKRWNIETDVFSGKVRTLTGGMLKNSGPPNEKRPEFIQQYSQSIFGVNPDKLVHKKSVLADRQVMVYQQTEFDIPIYGATLTLFYDDGNLVRVQSNLIETSGTPNLPQALVSRAQAFENLKTREQTLSRYLASKETTIFALGRPSESSPAYYLYRAPNQKVILVHNLNITETIAGHNVEKQALVDANTGRVVQVKTTTLQN